MDQFFKTTDVDLDLKRAQTRKADAETAKITAEAGIVGKETGEGEVKVDEETDGDRSLKQAQTEKLMAETKKVAKETALMKAAPAPTASAAPRAKAVK